MASHLGIDVGRTSTDLLLLDDKSGATHVLKTPVAADDPVTGIMAGIRRITAEAGVSPSDVTTIFHSASVHGAAAGKRDRIGLLVTAGFEQMVQLGRGQGAGASGGIVTTIGIAERIDARGRIQAPLDEAKAKEAVRRLLDTGVTGVAISLLHAYANPVHEQRLKSLIKEASADLPVTVSSDVLPEAAEFERTVAAVVDASAGPRLRSFMHRLKTSLREAEFSSAVRVMRSDGGSMTGEHAAALSLLTSKSGAAAGACAAATVAERAGHRDALAIDMGGGATTVSIVLDGQPVISRKTTVRGANIGVPSVGLSAAGGGSNAIARLTAHGALRVGPESAVADPGPACAGKGGIHPTLLDANVVLGLVPAVSPVGGFNPDTAAAEQAIARLADLLGVSLHVAAKGIRDLANEKLYGALRQTAAAHGCAPRDMALVAYGGAGPLHANALARLCGDIPAIVPANPGMMSTYGFLTSAPRHEIARSYRRPIDDASAGDVADMLNELAAQAGVWLDEEGVSEAERSISFEIDVRYGGQGAEIAMPVNPDSLSSWGLRDLGDRFRASFEQQYGFPLSSPVELVRMRVIAHGDAQTVGRPVQAADSPDAGQAKIDEQRIFLDGQFLSAAVYDGRRLVSGDRVAGPALVCQPDSTTVIDAGFVGTLDAYMTMVISPEAGRA